MVIQRVSHGLGFRHRLHCKDLPGTPDLVYPRLGKVVFVHGCYWHRHRCKAGRSTPASNRAAWEAKFERNTERDQRVRRELRALGWEVLVVWECWTKDHESLAERLSRFLNG